MRKGEVQKTGVIWNFYHILPLQPAEQPPDYLDNSVDKTDISR
jgi:hypothetical protein